MTSTAAIIVIMYAVGSILSFCSYMITLGVGKLTDLEEQYGQYRGHTIGYLWLTFWTFFWPLGLLTVYIIGLVKGH